MTAVWTSLLRWCETKSRWTLLGVCGFLILFYLFSYYPGFLSADPVDQLREARAHVYSNWHPALMGYLWHFLDKIHPGQALMLLFQILLFVLGLSLLSWNMVGPSRAPFLMLLVGLSPPVLAIIGIVWKDVHMAAAFFCAIGLYTISFRLLPKFAWPLRVVCLALLVYGTAARHNAASVSLPLMVWAGLYWIAQRPRERLQRKLAIIGGFSLAGLLLYPLGSKINATIADNNNPRLAQYGMMFDLVGMSVAADENLLPEFLITGPRGQPLEVLRQTYDSGNCVPLFFVGDKLLGPVQNEAEFTVLMRRWLEVMAQRPVAYARHRYSLIKQLFAFRTDHTNYVFQGNVVGNALGLQGEPRFLARKLIDWHNWLKDSLLFRPWFYLLPAIYACFRSVSLRRRALVETALAWSSLLYALPYLILAQASDFRYLWYSAVAGILLYGKLLFSALSYVAKDYFALEARRSARSGSV